MDFSWIEDPEQRAKAEAEYKTTLEKAVGEEVAGLKSNAEKLKGEKIKIAEALEELKAKSEGVDLDKAKEALALIEQTKQKDLLEEGKLEEYVQAQVQTKQREIEAQFSSQLDIALQEKDSITQTATKYETLFKNKIMEDNLREVALKSGCKADAEVIRDIVVRGKQVFALTTDETGIEAKNADGSFKKTMDGDKILTPDAWVDDLKKICPYYFPESAGTGAAGGGGGGKTGTSDDLQDQITAAAASGDMELFTKLRRKQGAKY